MTRNEIKARIDLQMKLHADTYRAAANFIAEETMDRRMPHLVEMLAMTDSLKANYASESTEREWRKEFPEEMKALAHLSDSLVCIALAIRNIARANGMDIPLPPGYDESGNRLIEPLKSNDKPDFCMDIPAIYIVVADSAR